MLWKKMIRDILSNKGSYVACLVIVIIGLIVFTAFSIVSDSLNLSKDTFYREQNFAQGFVELVSMPEHNVERLSRVEGIKEISGRVVREVRVNAPEREESIYLRLVSLDLLDSSRVNDVRLLEGEELKDRELNAWVDNQFFHANELEMGQEIEVVAGGRAREVTITGMGMSPEFTYPLRTQTELFPNPEQFGIAFLPLDTMAALFPDVQGRVNDLVFTLEPDADFDRVKDRLEPELEQYGLKTIYSRDDQVSHLMLTEEITMLETLSTSFPLLFLSIAGVILYIMLKRMVEQQRGQIGILKALGYSDKEIVFHYLSYALTVGAVGGLLGGFLGILSATPLTELMLEFFNVPEVYEGFSLYYLMSGLLLSLTVFLISGYHGCKQALRLKPAEAMRPPAPVLGTKNILEKIGFFSEMLTIQGKMAVRNLTRNKGRSAFMFLGIMLSCAVVALTWSFNDLVDKMIFYQYEEVEVYDARVTLSGPDARDPVERELEGHTEVARVEPIAEVPVTLSHHWQEEDVPLIGITRGSSLYNILDSEGRRVIPSDKGLILSERLADKLNVSVGSTLELESPFLRDEDSSQRVSVYEIIPQYLGMNAYMELSGLEELLGQGKLATSFLVNVNNNENKEGGISLLRDRYRESELVAGVDGREERIGQAAELMETFGVALYIYVLVGVIIGFSIIYSSSFIIVSERSRELASMRVLGMTSREVFSVITFEQWFLSFFAMLAALPLAQLMQQGLASELSTDMYILPGELSSESLFAAAVITSLSIWIAQRFALKKVRDLSLVEVLKFEE